MATSKHLLLSGLTLLIGASVCAADPAPSAAVALKILTQPLPQAASTAEPASPAPARQTLTVQRSETLDQLVHRLYPGWPLKDEVLRRALAELNPQAIPSAANNLLKRGSTLTLPTPEDLRRTLLQHYPAAGDLVRIKVEHEVEESSVRATATGVDKRRWVRFP